MPSTLRNDTRRAVLLARIATSWDKRPGLTLGQLLREALRGMPGIEKIEDLASLDDAQIAEAIERFVLLK